MEEISGKDCIIFAMNPAGTKLKLLWIFRASLSSSR